MRVVYGEKMVVEQPGHMSPSSYKPRLLVEHLQRLELPLQLHEPPALSVEDLCLAHDREYVERVLSCKEANGFGNYIPEVAGTLPYTCGSLYLAAKLALEHGLAASFSSGFHHACYSRAGGYCTFNGLIVTARKLYLEGVIRKLLILDLDYHFGDGTHDIMNHLGLHDWIDHETFGHRLKQVHQADEYLRRLRSLMQKVGSKGYDLVLYQAGADVHVKDPLGGLLTSDQILERDKMVFEACQSERIPLAWNLAGGYRRDENDTILPVLKIHEATYRAALEVFKT